MPARSASDEALEALHRERKAELLAEIERRTGVRLAPDVLLVAFARRAATYKRPDLVLRDPERVGRLLKGRQLQLVFAGKAHPADRAGKADGRAAGPGDPPVAGRRRLPRELRHGPGAPPDARGRRVAQHAATAARGQRHLRDEGRAQRRAPLLDPRRLVARGVRARRERLGDRRRRRGRAARGARRPRPRRALPDPRGRGAARLRGPPPVARDDAGLDPDGRRRASPPSAWSATTSTASTRDA